MQTAICALFIQTRVELPEEGCKSGKILKRAACVEARGTSFSRRETEAASQGRDWNHEGLSALGFD